MAIAAKKFLIDIESGPLDGSRRWAVEIVELGHAYDLCWIDPGFHEAAGRPVAEFEKVRRFKYVGGAIAWARRQLFHGRVFGDAIEMRVYRLYTHDGEPREEEHSVTDITLAGFCRWDRRENSGFTHPRQLVLGKPERKCRVAAQ